MLPSSRTTRSRAYRTRRALGLLSAGVLALGLSATVTGPSDAAPGSGGGSGGGAGDGRGAGLRDLSSRVANGQGAGRQTSDGVRGRTARHVSARAAKARTITNTVTGQWQIAPGLDFTRFDRLDSVRGNVRVQQLTLDASSPALSLDYAGAKVIAKTSNVQRLTTLDGGIAGINGDFFDIGDTGASLGIGSDRQDGLLKGPVTGWNNAFYVDRGGFARVGTLSVTTKFKHHADVVVDALNPPSVPQGGIAVYTDDWGKLDGYQVTDHQRKRVRQVVVRNGRIVSNRGVLTTNQKVSGKVLIGRGKGARTLSRLKVGTRGNLNSKIVGKPPVVITGDRPILLSGVRQVINDEEMHPRTAIGIDRDTNKIIIVVVDGRQSFSRGMTMVEMAQLMTELGAEDALNLDGGGSSTMLAPDQFGVMNVQNSPSDGHLRKVANGLVVNFDATKVPPAPAPTATPTPTPTMTTTPTP